MRFLLSIQAVMAAFAATSSSSRSFLEAVGQARTSEWYPPESCSCGCCIVQPDGGCGMPGPQHWKHHGCTYGLCGDKHVLSENGPTYASNKKKEFCFTHCGSKPKAEQGSTCECKNGNSDPWSCPHGE
eukprot:gnl/MRDRNA2_/MRDRNA2_116801_c0_seq1.p1 gnl/MRDRNA2_/MRDRNA2_116801_c0~~gnl/MRDRNA2_/MRDRNA2_116801_c0_seq1.p1  ORF type:complete len:128 (+),score=17.33 gnl/MRDRNA2_/MRDRNA2_116801_c0_seq1:63-446(+)